MAGKAKQIMITEEGYQKLVDELDYLKNTRRAQVKEDIKVARSFGDLSENAEYDEARTEQAKVEARILELEETILNATVINENAIDKDIVSVGSCVKVYDVEFDEEIEYNIVGTNEADPVMNLISDQSPIGKALLGARAGDTIIAEIPNGQLHLKVIEVSRSK